MMFVRILSNLSYANVMATIAVFIALGGTSYAVVSLPRNSVGKQQLRNRSVGSPELRSSAVRSKHIHNGSITTKDIADALARRGIEIDRHKIDLDEPLKSLGTYKVAIKVYSGLAPEVTIVVEPKG
jgi:hypothetical protein